MLDPVNSTNNNDEDDNEHKKAIEKILQEFESNYDLSVKSIQYSSGSEVGDNYMSVVNRLKIIGELADNSGKL